MKKIMKATAVGLFIETIIVLALYAIGFVSTGSLRPWEWSEVQLFCGGAVIGLIVSTAMAVEVVFNAKDDIP